VQHVAVAVAVAVAVEQTDIARFVVPANDVERVSVRVVAGLCGTRPTISTMGDSPMSRSWSSDFAAGS
jgi:hypothetical protein